MLSFFMSIIVMLVDRKNIAYSSKGKSSKVKKFVRKTLMNKKLITQQANRKKSCSEKVCI